MPRGKPDALRGVRREETAGRGTKRSAICLWNATLTRFKIVRRNKTVGQEDPVSQPEETNCEPPSRNALHGREPPGGRGTRKTSRGFSDEFIQEKKKDGLRRT